VAGSGERRTRRPVERVWVVRHGQVVENLQNPSQRMTSDEFDAMVLGSEDSPLTEIGRTQIESVAAMFSERDLAAVHTSPLPRAQESAAILAGFLDLPMVVIEGFRELVPALNRVRHQRRRRLRYWFLRSMTRQFLFPRVRGGESISQARRRVRAAWRELLGWRPSGAGPGPGSERLVTAHRGTVMLLRSVLKRDREWRVVRSSLENGGITEIVRRDLLEGEHPTGAETRAPRALRKAGRH
jgi:broad specificity phosphatase PhoE